MLFPSSLRSQIVTSNRGGTRYIPFAFTEHGITMAASILKSDTAIRMNIAIVRAFIELRKFACQYADIIVQLKDLKDRVGNHDSHLDKIYEALDKLLTKQDEELDWDTRQRIGFKTE